MSELNLKNLSVKELKEMMAARHISFADCFEKSDLVEKLMQVYKIIVIIKKRQIINYYISGKKVAEFVKHNLLQVITQVIKKMFEDRGQVGTYLNLISIMSGVGVHHNGIKEIIYNNL